MSSLFGKCKEAGQPTSGKCKSLSRRGYHEDGAIANRAEPQEHQESNTPILSQAIESNLGQRLTERRGDNAVDVAPHTECDCDN